jgi:hypothetical protein
MPWFTTGPNAQPAFGWATTTALPVSQWLEVYGLEPNGRLGEVGVNPSPNETG